MLTGDNTTTATTIQQYSPTGLKHGTLFASIKHVKL